MTALTHYNIKQMLVAKVELPVRSEQGRCDYGYEVTPRHTYTRTVIIKVY